MTLALLYIAQHVSDLVVQPTLGYHITNRQSRYITPARLKSAYTTQRKYSLAPEDGRINV